MLAIVMPQCIRAWYRVLVTANSDALKEVPDVKDGVSIASREAVVMSDSDTETDEFVKHCSADCPMRVRVAMLEGYLAQVLQERDEAQRVVEEIRLLMRI